MCNFLYWYSCRLSTSYSKLKHLLFSLAVYISCLVNCRNWIFVFICLYSLPCTLCRIVWRGIIGRNVSETYLRTLGHLAVLLQLVSFSSIFFAFCVLFSPLDFLPSTIESMFLVSFIPAWFGMPPQGRIYYIYASKSDCCRNRQKKQK